MNGYHHRYLLKISSYILDSRYQQFHDGYGIVLTSKNHYNVMGWNVLLLGYDRMHTSGFKMACLVQRLALMSPFPTARSSEWFVNNVQHLEDYRTDDGTYVFPKLYVQEKRNSYFVTGAHMGLGENRRQKLGYEIESSFWMLKVRRNDTAKEVEQ